MGPSHPCVIFFSSILLAIILVTLSVVISSCGWALPVGAPYLWAPPYGRMRLCVGAPTRMGVCGRYAYARMGPYGRYACSRNDREGVTASNINPTRWVVPPDVINITHGRGAPSVLNKHSFRWGPPPIWVNIKLTSGPNPLNASLQIKV